MSLAPDHLTDLHKSGLSDATIAACLFKSLRPHDIKLKAVESAYAIPYFDLNGKENCFSRWKLFPPLQRDGKTQKYHQLKDTTPSLYLPPLTEWATIAADVARPLLLTEGEKKAAAMCQAGFACIGVAGVWCWREKLEQHERMVLPAVEQFIWKGRVVELVPDSDVWRPEKQAALDGFYALAQELVARGAKVEFVVLPEAGQGKVGLDDWLLQQHGTSLDSWARLPRAGLTDARLKKSVKWWQDWSALNKEITALQRPDEAYTIETELFTYRVHFPKLSLLLTFSRVELGGRGLQAELAVKLYGRALREHTFIQVQSNSAQTDYARTLSQTVKTLPWRRLIELACAAVVTQYRELPAPTVIDLNRSPTTLTFAVNPFVFHRKPTVLFCDGGKGKSTFALFLAALVAAGGSSCGFSALKGVPLYLDWEDDDDVHLRRLHALHAGHPELSRDVTIFYDRLKGRLVDNLDFILRRVTQTRATFLVIDSLLAAAGGKADAEVTEAFFTGIRHLNLSTLIIAHTAKQAVEGQTATIYGSAFNSNYARNVWELKTEQELDDDHSIIGLFNRKVNYGRKHEPIGLKVTFSVDQTYLGYEPADLTETVELVATLPTSQRILALLRDGVLRSALDIADELGIPPGTVKPNLSRMAAKGKLQSYQTEGVVQYGLPA